MIITATEKQFQLALFTARRFAQTEWKKNGIWRTGTSNTPERPYDADVKGCLAEIIFSDISNIPFDAHFRKKGNTLDFVKGDISIDIKGLENRFYSAEYTDSDARGSLIRKRFLGVYVQESRLKKQGNILLDRVTVPLKSSIYVFIIWSNYDNFERNSDYQNPKIPLKIDDNDTLTAVPAINRPDKEIILGENCELPQLIIAGYMPKEDISKYPVRLKQPEEEWYNYCIPKDDLIPIERLLSTLSDLPDLQGDEYFQYLDNESEKVLGKK